MQAYVNLWVHMTRTDYGNTGSGNGLSPDIKPWPEPILTYNQPCFVAFIYEVLMNVIHNSCSKIPPLKLLPHFPEAGEVTQIGYELMTER